MATIKESTGQATAETRRRLRDALAAAGISGQINNRSTELTENSEVVLRRRYLSKDREGNVLEDPDGMFRYDGHLIAVRASANRSKGSKGPEEWKPPSRDYWCQYATDWIVIKGKWDLTATETEAAALEEMLDACVPPLRLRIIPSPSQ